MSHSAIDYALKVKGLRPQAKLLLIGIASFMQDNESDCSPSTKQLCAVTGFKDQSVTKYRSELKDFGVLSIGYQRGSSGNNLYSIVGYRGATSNASQDKINAVFEDFGRFWALYPKKQAKRKAEIAWMKARPKPADVQKALRHVEHMINRGDWVKENLQFIPMAATYINNERWNDEIIEQEGKSDYAFL